MAAKKTKKRTKPIQGDETADLVIPDKILLELQLMVEKQAAGKARLEAATIDFNNTRLQQQVLQLQLDKQHGLVAKAAGKMQEMKKEADRITKDYKEYIVKVTKELNLSSNKWGFDPESGKVVLDDGHEEDNIQNTTKE